MRMTSWLVLFLFAAGGAAALGAEPAEMIWWSAQDRARPTGATRPDGRPSAGRGHPGAMPQGGMRTKREPGKRPQAMPERKGGMPGGGHPGKMRSRGKPSADAPDAAQMPSRAEMLAMMRGPKTLHLRWGQFPAAGDSSSALGRAVKPENIQVWIRGPDGSVAAADLDAAGGALATKCPPEAKEGAEWLGGLYVVGMHLDAGVMDWDADGRKERVHFYTNSLVSHRASSGVQGDKPDTLFNDSQKVALEIAPVLPASSQGPAMATSQMGMVENKLRVLFKGRPLANAEVCVLADSGWRNKVLTDGEGVATVIPVGKKSDGAMRLTPRDQCLYVVLHKEAAPGQQNGGEYTGEYHCASLLMGVRMPGPEWQSKEQGFTVLAASSAGFLVLAGALAVYRRSRRGRQIMVEFERHRVRRES